MSRTASGNCEEAAREERSLYMAVVCACAPTHSTLSAPRPSTSKVDRSRFEVTTNQEGSYLEYGYVLCVELGISVTLLLTILYVLCSAVFFKKVYFQAHLQRRSVSECLPLHWRT